LSVLIKVLSLKKVYGRDAANSKVNVCENTAYTTLGGGCVAYAVNLLPVDIRIIPENFLKFCCNY